MKTLVVYYSKTGSNKFLAEKIKEELNCDIEEIKPRFNLLFFQIMYSLTRFGFGIKKLQHNPAKYDRIFLVSPIWMGSLIYAPHTFLKKYKDGINNLNFLTCCGGGEKEKDDKFGYNSVFNKVTEIVGDKCKNFKAISTLLTLPEDKQEDDQAVMAARINSETFKDKVLEKFNLFISRA